MQHTLECAFKVSHMRVLMTGFRRETITTNRIIKMQQRNLIMLEWDSPNNKDSCRQWFLPMICLTDKIKRFCCFFLPDELQECLPISTWTQRRRHSLMISFSRCQRLLIHWLVTHMEWIWYRMCHWLFVFCVHFEPHRKKFEEWLWKSFYSSNKAKRRERNFITLNFPYWFLIFYSVFFARE